jgi:hypothetical protein
MKASEMFEIHDPKNTYSVYFQNNPSPAHSLHLSQAGMHDKGALNILIYTLRMSEFRGG